LVTGKGVQILRNWPTECKLNGLQLAVVNESLGTYVHMPLVAASMYCVITLLCVAISHSTGLEREDFCGVQTFLKPF
jgi:hypothetical protein